MVRRRPLRALLLAVMMSAALAALVVVPVAPASAHDALEATEPASGSVVAHAPSAARLTFNNTPLALGSEIVVKDQSGANQSDEPASIVGNHVTRNVKTRNPGGARAAKPACST